MGYGGFRGGVHPFRGKDITKEKAISEYLPQKELVYPLSQHIGAPAKAVVSAGDEVLAGQILGEAAGPVSANVISSVSGRVRVIERRMLATGVISDSVIVENDREYRLAPGIGKAREPKEMTKEEIRTAVKNAGIVGLGGAGFPTHVKLAPKDDDAIEYVIVNAVECEPYLTGDYRLMLEEAEGILAGLQVLLRLFEKAKGIIAIEADKPEAAKRMKAAVEEKGLGDSVEVCVLKTKYPQGAERNLIFSLTGRRLNSKKLPPDAGCIVSNASTVHAVGQAVCEGLPLMNRIITVTGNGIANPGNFRVKTGTNYGELIEAAGGFACRPEKVIAGGPMMGMALTVPDVPVTKTSSALLVFEKDPVAEVKPGSCIRCGRCVKACPCRLLPLKMWQACKHYNLELFQKLYGTECYECGSCTYVCPARLSLTQSFKQARMMVFDQKKQARSKTDGIQNQFQLQESAAPDGLR
ncbi:electron transport complex subunit RsxC [Candidatus Merdisoma sp. JLR.KK011]|uniref:electron transport complex subunit RsxC n=1 Tax=Candidatus Merdisoma sp. JLR.KK011 TaxID=3114299 RepID=UPI002FF3DACC